MPARSLLVAVLMIVGCASAPATTPRAAPASEVTIRPVAGPSAVAISAEPPSRRVDPVTVLYRGHLPADFIRPGPLVITTIFGIERARERAWLTHSISGTGTAAFELVHVPLSATAPDAAPLERWTASPKAAAVRSGSAFSRLTGTLEDDLARYATIFESVGPHVTTSQRAIAVSHDHIIYEDGDHLTLRGRDGKTPRYFSRGVQSAYGPTFSPDGQTAAFFGCDGAIVRRSHTLPEIQACYALYIATLKGTPVRIPEVSESSVPVFSADGRFVYATSIARSKTVPSKREGGCLFRVEAAPPHARERVFCAPADGALSFQLASDGKTALVEATTQTPDLSTEFTWLSLPDGRVLGATKLPLASASEATLSTSGLLVTTSGRGVIVADASGKVRVVPGLEKAFVSTTAQWDGDRVYALRTTDPDVEEIIRIDARAAIEGPGG